MPKIWVVLVGGSIEYRRVAGAFLTKELADKLQQERPDWYDPPVEVELL